MRSATIPSNELERLRALDAEQILDTDPEPGFDTITELAASMFDVPIVLVSLVASDRQWFKSRVGLDACETTRDVSFCAHAVADRESLVVEDATKDDRFFDNPLVTGDPEIRFYAGVLIHGDDPEMPYGTLCLIDRKPRSFPARELEMLKQLGQQVEAQLGLRRALRDLAEASQAKFRLLASVGHELRTPLNGILGMQQLLETTELDDEQQEYVELLRVSGNYLNWSVDNLLAAALGESGEAVLAPFNLREMLHELCELRQPEGRDQPVAVRLDWLAGMEPWRVGDAQRLRESLVKLLDNAIAFTDEGEVVISVRQSDGDVVSLTVEDTGPGIPADKLDWIFEEFTQIEPESNNHPDGLGLGLALARRNLEAVDGRIFVESELGSGSRFTVQLTLRPLSA